MYQLISSIYDQAAFITEDAVANQIPGIEKIHPDVMEKLRALMTSIETHEPEQT